MENVSYTGEQHSFAVNSYRQNVGSGVLEGVPWKAQFAENDGPWIDTPPAWLTGFTTSGGLPAHPEVSVFLVTAIPQVGIDNRLLLQNTPARGDVSIPYNLANQTNGSLTDENTANCYVVSAPGYYSFPLVYGNAIKNGVPNTSAYISTKTGGNILTTFINHTGNSIIGPYIKDNNCQPAKAELVWQDAPNLITDIKYDNTGKGRISFKVDKSSIQPGNAVIAIKDASDKVLWSWHIWVTYRDISKTIEVTNYQSQKYKFMPVNLGWCDSDAMVYPERSCRVKITAGDKSIVTTITQHSETIFSFGNHPYYQWGRKDPFLPSDGLSNTNKTWYDKDGNAHTESPKTENFSTGATCIMNYILKPDVMQSQYYGDNTYANLWSADNNVYTANDENVIKTIYDPSPVGFKLPPGNVFTGFTTTGGSTSTSSEINGTWSSSSLKGWNFYTDSSKSKTIFFPASGYRYRSNGMVSNVSSYGFYWSAVPSSPTKGRYLYFYSLQVIPLSTSNYRAVGFGVRSSQE